ncbi:cyclase family protein [Bradymonas sediminis]|uniref:Uncharacterized protein n=1 Tax=Bradymonas sediminis TaxID=1548548 RepID=A0A2Z4FMZ1_9DELT|nr:cyclase family protein [Bradymonas sediminis]AWV90292.1 hypothetical protein DN745_13515 [Bradymonas sediminis]TDP75737.1 putative cyclase [Bradymonas sediminis]
MTKAISLQITLGDRAYRVDPTASHTLAIPLYFEGLNAEVSNSCASSKAAAQPNAFHLTSAHAAPARAEGFVGDTRLGGSANCADIHLNPHGNGTHTECVGHLVDEAVAVGELATQALIPAVILSVGLERLGDTDESYGGASAPDDRVLTRRALESAWRALKTRADDVCVAFCEALILRTLPNSADKMTRQYGGSNPPYPTAEAVAWLGKMGCEHLVLDLPSLDREVDQSRLPNHHRFFDLPPGAHSLQGLAPSPKTVTEMAFIPDELGDCPGFLSLQIPRFALDAAPSRPLFFNII